MVLSNYETRQLNYEKKEVKHNNKMLIFCDMFVQSGMIIPFLFQNCIPYHYITYRGLTDSRNILQKWFELVILFLLKNVLIY